MPDKVKIVKGLIMTAISETFAKPDISFDPATRRSDGGMLTSRAKLSFSER